MGASIFYRQVKPLEGESLASFAPSTFIETLEKAFGAFPCQLDKEDIPVLKGMAAMCRDGAMEDYGNPYQHLIDAIEKLGRVEVYACY